nr:MAG: hypothetical protein [Bacteriophage sp.]
MEGDMVVRKYEGYSGRMICGTDHLPEIGPAGLPFLDQPPPLAKVGDRNGKRSTSQKKECLFCI